LVIFPPRGSAERYRMWSFTASRRRLTGAEAPERETDKEERADREKRASRNPKTDFQMSDIIVVSTLSQRAVISLLLRSSLQSPEKSLSLGLPASTAPASLGGSVVDGQAQAQAYRGVCRGATGRCGAPAWLFTAGINTHSKVSLQSWKLMGLINRV
jgi:hypothetical protein